MDFPSIPLGAGTVITFPVQENCVPGRLISPMEGHTGSEVLRWDRNSGHLSGEPELLNLAPTGCVGHQ